VRTVDIDTCFPTSSTDYIRHLSAPRSENPGYASGRLPSAKSLHAICEHNVDLSEI